MPRQKATVRLDTQITGGLVPRRTQSAGAAAAIASWRLSETLQCLVELAAHRASLMVQTDRHYQAFLIGGGVTISLISRRSRAAQRTAPDEA